MAKIPQHEHQYEQIKEEVSGPDRRQRVTVVTTWQCSIRVPFKCYHTKTTVKKLNYWPNRDK